MTDFTAVDEWMSDHSVRLQEELGLTPVESHALATTLSAEAEGASDFWTELRQASPVPLAKRYEEFAAFETWMLRTHAGDPFATRAQVMVAIYYCFAYLRDSLLMPLEDKFAATTAMGKCCRFLTEGQFRSFRNAVAHSNWCYADDMSGLDFWAYPKGKHSPPYERLFVSQEDLNFWQHLARCVARVLIVRLRETEAAQVCP